MDSLAQKSLLITEARTYQDITKLLRGWYTFRIFVRFKKPRMINGRLRVQTHRFGYEQNCSYSQCFNGHFAEVLLDKSLGYKNCIEMIEETFRGEFRYAVIYMRTVLPNGGFDVICRHYDENGKMTRQEDPELTSAHNVTLYHSVYGDHLYVHTRRDMTYDEILAEVADIGTELHPTALLARYSRPHKK